MSLETRITEIRGQETIGTRIKQLRKSNGLTQRKLADLLNITPAAVSNYENGHASPSNSVLVDLAKVLNTSTHYLIGSAEKVLPEPITKNENTYQPSIPIPPGETLQEILDDRGITKKELAEKLQISLASIEGFIKGMFSLGDIEVNEGLKESIADRLGRFLGIPASFWNNLESNYKATLNRSINKNLKALHNISVSIVHREQNGNFYCVKVRATSPYGVMYEENAKELLMKECKGKMIPLEPYELATAVMKAETKAKNRLVTRLQSPELAIGRLVTELRQELGYSQQFLARLSGVSVSDIGAIEMGDSSGDYIEPNILPEVLNTLSFQLSERRNSI